METKLRGGHGAEGGERGVSDDTKVRISRTSKVPGSEAVQDQSLTT